MAVLEIRAAHTRHVAICGSRDRSQQFIVLERRRKETFEELVSLDLAVTVAAGDGKRRAEALQRPSGGAQQTPGRIG